MRIMRVKIESVEYNNALISKAGTPYSAGIVKGVTSNFKTKELENKTIMVFGNFADDDRLLNIFHTLDVGMVVDFKYQPHNGSQKLVDIVPVGAVTAAAASYVNARRDKPATATTPAAKAATVAKYARDDTGAQIGNALNVAATTLGKSTVEALRTRAIAVLQLGVELRELLSSGDLNTVAETVAVEEKIKESDNNDTQYTDVDYDDEIPF